MSRKKRIAKKDIKVVKFAIKVDYGKTRKVKPYYLTNNDVVYEEGKTYTAELGIFENEFNELTISTGLHAYAKSRVKVKYGSGFVKVMPYFPFTYDRVYGTQDVDEPLVRMDCHIPKGATYYMDIEGETVSDTLVVDKITDC